MTDLDARLRSAHAHGDHDALITLYTQAGDAAETTDAACFFLTQAYIFALERGHPAAQALHRRLAGYGRI